MFNNPTPPSKRMDEGIVTQVDPLRRVCKVKTLRGQNLDQVSWLSPVGNSSRGGDRTGPSMGNRVAISYDFGYPLIIGALPQPQSDENSFPLNIDSGSQQLDTGDYSASGALVSGDSNKPGDIVNGDRVISSEGGGVISALRGGSVLLKSSALCQIFLSKIDDVVKIVSRNYEHYTDVCSDIVKNIGGRIYRYTGYSNSFSSSKNENYTYHQYYGDVALAEAVKTQYLNTPGSAPSSAVIFKEQITGGGGELMKRTIDTSGNHDLKVTGTTYTEQTATSGQIVLSYNGQHSLTMEDSDITLVRSDGATIVMDSAGIHMSYSGGTVDMKSSGIFNEYNGHFCNITSGGVQIG